jgi:hypothetical protein
MQNGFQHTRQLRELIVLLCTREEQAITLRLCETIEEFWYPEQENVAL